MEFGIKESSLGLGLYMIVSHLELKNNSKKQLDKLIDARIPQMKDGFFELYDKWVKENA